MEAAHSKGGNRRSPGKATGNSELARAAEGFARAARPAWGRTPAPTPRTAVIRTAAYLMASCVPGRYRGHARRVLILALTGLARTLADLRIAQDQRLQSAAADRAADRLADDAAATAWEQAPHSAAAGFPGQPVVARHVPAGISCARADATVPARQDTGVNGLGGVRAFVRSPAPRLMPTAGQFRASSGASGCGWPLTSGRTRLRTSVASFRVSRNLV